MGKQGAEWKKVYGKMHSAIKFVPSIVNSTQFLAVKKYFSDINIQVGGYFQWQKLNVSSKSVASDMPVSTPQPSSDMPASTPKPSTSSESTASDEPNTDTDIIGRYAGYFGVAPWASNNCPNGPEHATINVEFGAKTDIKSSIANYPDAKWNAPCK